MSDRQKLEDVDEGWDYETDLDDPSEDTGSDGPPIEDGDLAIVCVEDLVMYPGSKAPYGEHTLRIVAGPLNDDSRDFGPKVGDDGTIMSWRHWEFISLSQSKGAKRRMRDYLRGVGYTGQFRLVSKDRDENGRTAQEQWQDMVCDREVVVRFEVKEEAEKDEAGQVVRDAHGQPRTRTRIQVAFRDGWQPLSDADWKTVSEVYDEFGPARGSAWSPDPEDHVQPIHEWTGEVPDATRPERESEPSLDEDDIKV